MFAKSKLDHCREHLCWLMVQQYKMLYLKILDDKYLLLGTLGEGRYAK